MQDQRKSDLRNAAIAARQALDPPTADEAARAAYLDAWKGLEPAAGYRAIVEAKLNALGVDPTARPEAKP